ncbi:MAG: hypothetical protein AAF542_07065 [Pseudomonadota bacterium]
MNASTAENWGFLDYLIEVGAALIKAQDLAKAIATQPPLSVGMIKRAITDAVSTTHYASRSMDTDQFLLAQQAKGPVEGVTTSIEERPADFTVD